jgi:serine/threonine protein kinase
MNLLKQPHIVWFHTAFRRGKPEAQNHYLILEWASGGNLRNLWNTFPRPALTSELIKATVQQLLGLVQALNKAHYPETGPNFRHGDLKPENILWFKDETGEGIGTLKIGDWGLAKQHYLVTEMRSNQTTTMWGTRRYEPPEEAASQGTNLLVSDLSGKKRSRLYDIWALGCITLEFLIWLMYGLDELNRFNRGMKIGTSDNTRFYLIRPVTGGKAVATVHDVVAKWMAHMAKDPICAPGSTALGNLLELVETRLLVVKLPERLGTFALPQSQYLPKTSSTIVITNNSSLPGDDSAAYSPDSHGLPTIVINDQPEVPTRKTIPTKPVIKQGGLPGRERARADELLDQMLIISGDDEAESYWFIGPPSPSRGPNVDDIRQNIQSLVVDGISVGGTERVSSPSMVISSSRPHL